MGVQHSTQSGIELHESKRQKEPARAASTANVTLSNPGATMDSVSLNTGDRVLLKNQSTASQNGIYTWSGPSTTLVRTSDCLVASDFTHGFLVFVREGFVNAATYWVYATQTTPIVVGTDSITFNPFNVASGTVTSVAVSVPADKAVSGSPVTSSGTIAITDSTQLANRVKAGPVSGGAATPAYRALVPADIPVFGASGVSHSSGAVPDPGASAGTTRSLFEDGTWKVPSGGSGGSSSGGSGSGALVPIMVIGPLTTTQATMPFAGIPQTGFRNLKVTAVVRSTLSASNATLGVQFNEDAGSNYAYETLADASGGLNRLSSASDTQAYIAYVPAATAPSGAAGVMDIRIPSYTGTAYQKAVTAIGSFEQATSSGNQYTEMGGGFWRSAAAITSLTLVLSGGNFDIGSYACLYGEMDTAGMLLTPASNLLFETTLTAAAASIDTGTLNQAYRDLRIEVLTRSDAATVRTQMLLQINGDTTAANYLNQLLNSNGSSVTSSGSTSLAGAELGQCPGTSSTPTTRPGAASATIAGYSAATFQKTVNAMGVHTDSGSTFEQTTSTYWTNTAAITSLKLLLASGNLVAGTVFRVYGEPVSAGGATTGTGTRLRISGNQSITDATDTIVTWDTEDTDADNQHYTSAANLTPATSVNKTAGSQAVTGTGTAFLTELSVGQVISIPGTAAEKRVVTGIQSNTSLTVNAAFANTATNQTATRINSAIVFRLPGFYAVNAGAYWASNATGNRKLAFVLNDTTVIAQDDRASIGATAMAQTLSLARQFAQWDFVEVQVRQNSGGALNLTADERTFVDANSRPTVLLADSIRRFTSTPVDGMTSATTGWARWSTPWQITVTNVRAGQHVLLRALASMSNGSSYTGAAIYRVTGGPTWLAGNTIGIDLHTKPVPVEYDDATPGTGTVVYEVYVGTSAGTTTMHHDAGSTFNLDNGSSLLVAEVYTPAT